MFHYLQHVCLFCVCVCVPAYVTLTFVYTLTLWGQKATPLTYVIQIQVNARSGKGLG